jgi:hypothetical protein
VTIQAIDNVKTVNYSDLRIINCIGVLNHSITSISITVTKVMMAWLITIKEYIIKNKFYDYTAVIVDSWSLVL